MKNMFKMITITVILSAGLFLDIYSKDYSVEYSELTESEAVIDLLVKNFRTEKINKEGVIYTSIVFDGSAVTGKKGYAEVPMLNTTVQLDDKNDISISAFDGEYTEIQLDYPLLPSRGAIYRNQEPDKIKYEIEPKSITDSWYPEEKAETTDPFIFRHVRGVNIYFYPFQYNPVKKTLRVYKNLKIIVKKDFTESTNPLTIKSGDLDPSMNSVYNSLFINYNESKFAHQIGEHGDILVIYTSRDTDAIQPYINWKREKGFKVHTTEVAAGANVKTTIKDAYVSNPDILYVQLVGDWTEIQCDLGGDEAAPAPMDPMLGCVSGTDLYPELIIGRFSAATSADVTVQVNKTITYEKTPDMTGTWYGTGLGIGSPEGEGIGDDSEIDFNHIDVIKENKLLPFTYETVYEAYGSPTSSTVANYVNSGIGVINYCGHGSDTSWGTSGYSNSNINSSTNGAKLPFIFSVACVNGAFHSGTCFAEAWLRKSGGGAVAALMSTINQPWVPPMRGQDYMNDILIGGYDYTANPGNGTNTTVSDQRTTFGSITMNGCVLMLSQQYSDVSTQNTIQTWTIFGDASLQVRTDKPKLIENTTEVIFPDYYNTKILSAGDPVEGARVTLFQNGISHTGMTDANGDVTIPHSFVDGDAILTITGFNLETRQTSMPVQAPEGPYLKINEYSFSSVYSGESVSAVLKIKNIGLADTGGINILLSCENQYITLTNDNYSFSTATIEPGEEIVSDNDISFDIDASAPDMEVIKFDVTLTDLYTKRTYESNIYITVGSPILSVNHIFSSPSAIQGQTRTVTFRIDNTGHAPIYDLTATLEQLTLFNSSVTDPVHIDSIAAESFAEVSFDCFYGEDIPNSSYLTYNLSVNSTSGYSLDYGLDTVVGLTDGFESGGFTANAWLLSGDTDWMIDSTVFYEGNFSASSGLVLDGKKSVMTASFNYISSGDISFFRKVSSEAGYDKLNFYIDGIFKKNWSGNSDWIKIVFEVPVGLHEFKWEFTRDNSMGGGSNCAWIDNLLATGISTTGIEDQSPNVPSGITLYQNYPNPFNPSTQIKFALSKASDVKLSVYNINGQLVSELVKGVYNSGFHTVEFDGSKLNSGVYYCMLETEGNTLTEKMVLIK